MTFVYTLDTIATPVWAICAPAERNKRPKILVGHSVIKVRQCHRQLIVRNYYDILLLAATGVPSRFTFDFCVVSTYNKKILWDLTKNK